MVVSRSVEGGRSRRKNVRCGKNGLAGERRAKEERNEERREELEQALPYLGGILRHEMRGLISCAAADAQHQGSTRPLLRIRIVSWPSYRQRITRAKLAGHIQGQERSMIIVGSPDLNVLAESYTVQSNTRHTPSSPALTRRAPPSAIAASLIGPLCPPCSLSNVPVRASQVRRVLSADAVVRRCVFGCGCANSLVIAS